MPPSRGEPKYITVVGQVVLKVMCEIPVLFSTKSVGLIEIISHPNVAKDHGCMTTKGIMDGYPARPFYITIANLNPAGVHLPKHQKLAKCRMRLKKSFTLNKISSGTLLAPKGLNIIAPVNAAHYKTAPDRLNQMAEPEAVKKRDEENLKND